MNSKDIRPYNEKGNRHGYSKCYWDNGQLFFKGNYVDGNRHGYWEQYYDNGQLMYKGNFVNGKAHGYWEYYCPNGKLNGKFYYQYGKKINLINFLIIKLYNLIKF